MTIGIAGLVAILVHFDAGCSDKRVTAFRLEGQNVGGEPPFFVSLHSMPSLFSKFSADFPNLECI